MTSGRAPSTTPATAQWQATETTQQIKGADCITAKAAKRDPKTTRRTTRMDQILQQSDNPISLAQDCLQATEAPSQKAKQHDSGRYVKSTLKKSAKSIADGDLGTAKALQAMHGIAGNSFMRHSNAGRLAILCFRHNSSMQQDAPSTAVQSRVGRRAQLLST